MSTDTLARRMIAASLVGLLLAVAFFALLPGADLTASRLFGSAAGFPVARHPFWTPMRNGFILTTDGTMIALLLILLHNRARPGRAVMDNGTLSFALLSYALGPGLVANGIFKSFWGRAHPRDIVEFGGRHLFTSPLLPADQCQAHCSFVSGEGSAVTTVALVVLLVLWPRLGRAGRRRSTAAGSALRVAFGGHFLSDVIFAALMMGVVVPATCLAVGAAKAWWVDRQG